MPRNYTITLNGCDDSTSFDMALTATQAELLERVAEASRAASEYSCEPTMDIRPTPLKEPTP